MTLAELLIVGAAIATFAGLLAWVVVLLKRAAVSMVMSLLDQAAQEIS